MKKYIELEGPEFSGKSTQASRLFNYLLKQGKKAYLVKLPGTTPLSQTIREIVKSKDYSISSYEDFLLNVASTQSVLDYINTLDVEYVIFDRFMSSMVVYQGYLSKELFHQDSLHLYESFQFRNFDVLKNLQRFYLRISPAEILKRRSYSGRSFLKDKYDSFDLSGFEEMVKAYDKSFSSDSVSFNEIPLFLLSSCKRFIINAEQDEDNVFNQIKENL